MKRRAPALCVSSAARPAAAALLCALVACEPSAPKPWVTPTLPSPRVDLGAGVEAGAAAGTHAGVEGGTHAGVEGGAHAGVEGGTHAGVEAGTNAGGEPPLTDLPAAEQPAAEQVAALVAGSSAWVAWRHGAQARVARLPLSELAALTAPLSLRALDRSAPLPLDALLAAAASAGVEGGALDLEGQLSLTAALAGRPWLLAAYGAPGDALAGALLFDLSDLSAPPRPLGLTGPLLTAARGEALWVVGRDPASGAVAWRWLTRGELSPVTVDPSGLAAPTSATFALGQWTLAAADGQCLTVAQRGAGRRWRCEAAGDARPFGDDERLTFVGPLGRPSAETGEGAVWSWEGTPGLARPPRAAEEGEALTPLSPLDGWAWVGAGLMWRAGVDAPRLWTARAERYEERDGALVELRRHALSAPLPTPDAPLAALDAPDFPVALTWDAAEGAPLLTRGEGWRAERPLAWAPTATAACLVEPERCDDVDHDCDGAARAGLCCEGPELSAAQLSDVISPDRGWLTAQSELGALLAIASQGSARLLSLPFTGGDAQLRATWPGVRRLTHIANRYSLVALAGEDAEGRPVLLWNINRDGQLARMDAPCAPLALTVVNTALRTRLICAEGVMEIEPALGAITPAAAPEPGEVRWATRWHPPAAAVDEVYIAVALGETAQLSLWREGGEEGLTLAAERGVYLPNSLGAMSAEDRAEPFMPPQEEGGSPSRARDRRLEVWSPQVGWTPALASRWPFSVSLSPFAPLALSVGYDDDPAKVGDSFLQRLTVYTHDLSPGGSFWGEPLKEQVSKDSLNGAHLAGFPDLGALRPNVLILIGGGLELRTVGCEGR